MVITENKILIDMFPHTTERAKTVVDQVGRTDRQMTYFLSSRAMWRPWLCSPDDRPCPWQIRLLLIYLLSIHPIPAALRSAAFLKWLPGFSRNTVSIPCSL